MDKKKDLKVSIIMPLYNVERFLCRSIESVLAQTYGDFELLLINDGSTDKSGDICDTYARIDKRVRVIHRTNEGVSAARNLGLDLATGNYICFVDSDDYVHPEMLSIFVEMMCKTNENVVACQYLITHGEELPVEVRPYEICRKSPEAYYYDMNVTTIIPWGKLYKKECFANLRYPVGKVHEDEYVTYKIIFECREILVAECPLYGYFHNDEGITKGKVYQDSRCFDKLDALKEQFLYFLENQKSDPARAARKYFFYSCKLLNDFDRTKKKEYTLLCKHVRHSFVLMKPYLGRYEKIYFYLLRFPFTPAWLINNDFEPIQKYLAKIKKIIKKQK